MNFQHELSIVGEYDYLLSLLGNGNKLVPA